LNPGNNGGNTEVAFTPSGNEQDLQSSISFPDNTEQYVSVTFNASSLVGNLYTNGALIATHTFPNSGYTPGRFGGGTGPTVNALGNDIYGDTQFQGTIYEFRIWNGVVSQRYLQASALAGSSVVINQLTPTSITMTTSATSIPVTGTAQASITVQLPQTGSSNLAATGDATNWLSSNPSVLIVNSSGLITGVGPGSATVSATIAGVTATSPSITVSQQALLHRYSFVSDASDSVGGANGTLVPPTTGAAATISNGLNLPGSIVAGNGVSGYVSLPNGLLTNTTSITVECWLTQNQANTWAEAWDFGTGPNFNFGFIPEPANNRNNGNALVAFTPPSGEVDVGSPVPFPVGSEQYVALTYNNFSLLGSLYTNGVLDSTTTMPNTSYSPGSFGGAGGTTLNTLGNDVYGDEQFDGKIYEFRIWNGAVSPVYLAASAVAGPGVVITNTVPQSLTVSVGSTTMVGSQTQQASVTGSFLQAANVPLTTTVTNWSSSNPSILTVSSSGLITAQSGGTATVTAIVNGVSSMSPLITVMSTAPTVSQRPVNTSGVATESASFSAQALGGALTYQWSFDGTPIAGATNNSLLLTNLTVNESGTYSILIANTIGSTNLSATLTVNQAVLLHRYSFVSDASDSVGGANGTIIPPSASGSPVTINNGLTLPGGGGGGFSGYVALPAGILTNAPSLTIECWVTQNAANQWGTIWDFGNNNNVNFELCPYPNPGARNNGKTLVAFEPNANEDDLDSPFFFPIGTEQYVTLTVNSATLVGNLYTNSAPEGSINLPNSSFLPSNIGGAGGTTENWLGNDVFGDTQFQGIIYELRIWNGAVSTNYLAISAVAGPGVVVTNTSVQSLTVQVPNASLIAGQTEQAAALGNFLQASGVNITTWITNWASSNPSILTVNQQGLITAVNVGSASISATIDGVTQSSASITVTSSGPVITQEPESTENLLAGASLITDLSVIGNPPLVYRLYNGSTLVATTTNLSTLTLAGLTTGSSGTYTIVVSNNVSTATSSPITVTVVAPTTYQQVLLSLGAVGYWPLNEASGPTAYDMIGGINGNYVGGISYQQAGPPNSDFGANSYAAGFDGTSAYVDIPGATINFTDAVSVVAWVQLIGTPPDFSGVFGHGDDSWRMSVNPAQFPGGNDGTSALADATGQTPLSLGPWYMLTYTYTGVPGNVNNGALYVNGQLAANNTILTAPTGDDLDAWIGASPDYALQRVYLGNIAETSLFHEALSAAQVSGLYNGVFVPGQVTIGFARSGSNLVLTWKSGTLLQASSLKGPWTTGFVKITV
jgi:uncharacterized protein YjdB